MKTEKERNLEGKKNNITLTNEKTILVLKTDQDLYQKWLHSDNSEMLAEVNVEKVIPESKQICWDP